MMVFFSRNHVCLLLVTALSTTTITTVNAQERLADETIRQAVIDYTGSNADAKAAVEETYGAIADWDVRDVTDMSELFQGMGSFNADLSAWRVERVTDMSRMFNSASSFNSDLTNWDTGSATDMTMMFQRASAFRGGDLSNWDVSQVTSMSDMFLRATNFNGDVTSWETSNVVTMHAMFESAVSFNQDLSSWDLGNCGSISYMFNEAISMQQALCWTSLDEAVTTDRVNPFCGSGTSLDPCCVASDAVIIDSCCSLGEYADCATTCEGETDAPPAEEEEEDETDAPPEENEVGADEEETDAPAEGEPAAPPAAGGDETTDAPAEEVAATVAPTAAPTPPTIGVNDTFTTNVTAFSFAYTRNVSGQALSLDEYLKEHLMNSFPNLQTVALDPYHVMRKDDTPPANATETTTNSTRMLRVYHRELEMVTIVYYRGNATFFGPPYVNEKEVMLAQTDAFDDTDALVGHLNKVTNVTEWTEDDITVAVGDEWVTESVVDAPTPSGETKGLSTTGLVIVIVAACLGGISLLVIIFVSLAKPSRNVN